MKRKRVLFHRTFLVVLLAAAAIPASAAPNGMLGYAGWQAWIETPKSGPAQLVITARLHMRTPGYEARLKRERILTSHPPIPVYQLIITPPTKPVIQVLTWIKFRYTEPVRGTAYKQVRIYYDGELIARISVKHRKR